MSIHQSISPYHHENKQAFTRLLNEYNEGWANGSSSARLLSIYNRMVYLKDKALPSVRLPTKFKEIQYG